MLRNLTFALLAVLSVTASTQAGLIAVATRVAGPADGAAFGASEASGGATTNLNALTNGSGDSLWVSYALGIKDDATSTAANEKIGGFDVHITSLGPTGGLHQRWNFDDSSSTYTITTPVVNNIASGDSHLVTTSTLFGRAGTEDRVAKLSDSATTTTGFNTANLGFTDSVRNWGIGTFLDGAWGLDAATQDAQVAGSTVNFAYIVVPRSYDISNLVVTVGAQTTNGTTHATIGSPVAFVGANFFAAVPEPASLSLLGLAMAGFGFIRRRSA